jgi:hypothetical protein
MNEAKITKEFHKKANQLIKQLGNHPLTNVELDRTGKKLINKNYKTFSQDTINLTTPRLCITNVDKQSESGSHWVALAITQKKIYVYDSFGRPTAKLLKILSKQAKGLGKTVVDSDADAEQFGDSVICGHLCLAFLFMVKKHGIKKALLI